MGFASFEVCISGSGLHFLNCNYKARPNRQGKGLEFSRDDRHMSQTLRSVSCFICTCHVEAVGLLVDDGRPEGQGRSILRSTELRSEPLGLLFL